MIVVVSIIVVLLTLILPAATELWQERKVAQAENLLQGVLISARADAIRNGIETGFLAFVDAQGNQHLARIERLRGGPHPCFPQIEYDPVDPRTITLLQHVYRLTDDPERILPRPMRIVPRAVVDVPRTAQDSPDTFSDAELAQEDFLAPPQDAHPAQRHRNFFTVLFSPDGAMIAGRDVLVIDCDVDGDGLGDRTALRVSPDPGVLSVQYISRTGDPAPLDPLDPEAGIPSLIAFNPTVGMTIAHNFPSVDGLLVYDDQLFRELDVGEGRAFLTRTGRPLFVSPLTGAVIRGEIGSAAEPVTP